MKNLVFKYSSVLLLAFIFLSGCTKEAVENNLSDTTMVKTAQSDAAVKKEDTLKDSRAPRLVYTESTKLSYIGNSQWQGSWLGSRIVFQGPTDTQLNDGLLDHFSLVGAWDGSMSCETAEIVPGYAWEITQFLAAVKAVPIMEVDWVEKSTGIILFFGYPPVFPTLDFSQLEVVTIKSTNWYRTVSTYSIPGAGIGSYTINKFKISIIKVDGHLEMANYNPNMKQLVS